MIRKEARHEDASIMGPGEKREIIKKQADDIKGNKIQDRASSSSTSNKADDMVSLSRIHKPFHSFLHHHPSLHPAIRIILIISEVCRVRRHWPGTILLGSAI